MTTHKFSGSVYKVSQGAFIWLDTVYKTSPWFSHSKFIYMCEVLLIVLVEVFRIIPNFRILRLTFQRKSASKC